MYELRGMTAQCALTSAWNSMMLIFLQIGRRAVLQKIRSMHFNVRRWILRGFLVGNLRILYIYRGTHQFDSRRWIINISVCFFLDIFPICRLVTRRWCTKRTNLSTWHLISSSYGDRFAAKVLLIILRPDQSKQ